MKDERSDQDLIAAFLATSDQRLFTRLHQRYYAKVYASCLRMMGQAADAQDQTQEVFCKVHARLHTFRGQARFSTWLFILTRNHCLSALDQQKKHPHQVLLDSVGGLHLLDAEETSLEQRWQQAQAILHQLSPADQQLLQRRYIDNQSVASLADEALVSQSAIKMRLKRARDQARKLHRR